MMLRNNNHQGATQLESKTSPVSNFPPPHQMLATLSGIVKWRMAKLDGREEHHEWRMRAPRLGCIAVMMVALGKTAWKQRSFCRSCGESHDDNVDEDGGK